MWKTARLGNLVFLTGKRYIHKYNFKMDKAYLRRVNDSDQFELSFHYVDEALKVRRQFNFSRKFSETLDQLLNRVATNVEKVINKKKKKQKGNSDAVDKVSVSLYLNEIELSKDITCSEVFLPEKPLLLKVSKSNFQVIINSPWVDSLSLPTSILSGFPVYPSKFDSVFTDRTLSEFIWSKSRDKNKWTDIGQGYIFIPRNEEIGHYLKLVCVPRNESVEGPSVEAVSNCTVEASPGLCPFEIRHQFTKEKAQGKVFRVMTYNILADLYCDSDYTREVLFPYCPPYALALDYRKQLFVKEILGYNSDLICLQEVDRKVYKNDLEPIMSYLGYEGSFTLKGGEVAEGLAFFSNKNRFQLLESHRYVLAEDLFNNTLFADICDKIKTNDKLQQRIQQRTTTLQINVVRSVEFGEVLVVANTHLYFHPDADHVRLLQGGIAIRYLENFIKQLKQKMSSARISLVFCGDFNSDPKCGILKLYTTGEVSKDCVDFKSNEDEAVVGVELKQNLKLDTACGTPKYTNFTEGFRECLDYIYYEKCNLCVTQVIPLPSDEELTQNTALPSIYFPSDHLALIADLKWN